MKIQFSTHIIDEVLEKKRFQREEFREKIISSVNNALDNLSHKIFFKEAYIFGSLTRSNKFSEDSDIDIGFIGLKDEDFFKALAYLLRELSSDVDIVQLEGHKYRNKIMKEGIKWIKKG